MIKRIDFNLFRVFEAIYRNGTLTQAAEELHVTQPAVSSALARLRKQFNDPLFVREGQRMAPTTLARTVAGDIFRALDILSESVQQSAGIFDAANSTQRFALGMRESIEFPMLVPLAIELQKLAPGVKLQSVSIDRRAVTKQLLSGELDFVLDVPLAVSEEIRQAPLYQAELCIAVRPKHPLLKKPLSLGGWLDAQHIVVSGRTSGPVIEDLALQRRGLRREVAVRCQSYYAACHLVANSDLVLVLPRYFGEWFRGQLPITLKPLPLPTPALEVMLYWNANNDRSPSHSWMRELLVRLARENS